MCYYKFDTMNRLIIVLLILVFTTGCNSQNNEINSKTNSTDNNNFDKTQLIKQAALLDGEWLHDNYLRNIEKTKSIYLNRNLDSLLFGFTLNKENLLSDTAFLFGYTVHEGGYGNPIIFDFQKNKFVSDSKRLKDNSGIPSVPFELTVINDSIVDMFYPEFKITDTYRKVTDIQTGLRKILFAGNYISIDKKRKFSFDKNGNLKGFDNYVYYDLAYDFGEGIEYDALIFFKTKAGGNWSMGDVYKFEFVSDTIKLYYVKTDWENMEHKIGGLTYTLIRE